MKRSSAALSMQTALVLSFALFVLLAAGVTGYLARASGRQAVQELATRLHGEMSGHIAEHVRDFLHTPHIINRLNSDLLSEGILDSEDERALELHFRKQIDAFPTVSSIYFGNTFGGLVNSGREPPYDSRYVIETEGFGAGAFRKWSVDKDGNRLSLLAEVPGFDARSRSWFVRALKSGSTVWSDAYVLFTGQDMAITASRPVYGKRGELLGVVAVDLFLSQLSSFLRTLNFGESGHAFIMDRSGLLVASSTGERPFVVSETGIKRLPSAESAYRGVQQASLFLLERIALGELADTRAEHRFSTYDEACYLQAIPLRAAGDIDWIVAVVIPESEFMSRIDESDRNTILLILIAVCLAILAGVVLARRMSLPVLRLNDSARAIARGETPPVLPVDCGIVEVGELSYAFNRMSEQLKRTIRGLHEEITVRKQAEEDLREAMERAEQLRGEAEAANRAKSDFLANMSHEIRTPLNGVIGFIDMLRGTRMDEEQREYVENVQVSSLALLEIISNILDISKIEAGKLEMNEARSDVPKLIDEALVIVGHSVSGKNIRLFSNIRPSFPRYAFVDPVRLRQVLVNLLANAVKFTDEGEVELSAVFFRTSPENRGQSLVADDLLPDEQGTGFFTFSVRDTGIGIRSADIPRLFRPFSQADASNTRQYGGTGLGLAISNGILKKMGSSLELESEPGKGSTFSFTLALRYENGSERDANRQEHPLERPLATVSASETLSRSLKFLIVEDVKMNRRLLRTIALKLLPSAEILEAENGEDGVRMYKEHAPDIVFMDMHMPLKNGCEAAAEIREIEKTSGKRIPIIALTADVLPETRERCLFAGMDAFLSKPIEGAALRSVFEMFLTAKK